jgi:hypothetical protein
MSSLIRSGITGAFFSNPRGSMRIVISLNDTKIRSTGLYVLQDA